MIRNVPLNSEVKGVGIEQYMPHYFCFIKWMGTLSFCTFYFYIIPIYMGPTNCLILLQGNLNTKERKMINAITFAS